MKFTTAQQYNFIGTQCFLEILIGINVTKKIKQTNKKKTSKEQNITQKSIRIRRHKGRR